MNEMSRMQVILLVFMIAIGAIMINITIGFDIIFFITGCAIIAMAFSMMAIEGGICIWRWWVPLRMGHNVTIDFGNNQDEVDAWLKDNVKSKLLYVKDENVYHFLISADAIGFKLRWV